MESHAAIGGDELLLRLHVAGCDRLRLQTPSTEESVRAAELVTRGPDGDSRAAIPQSLALCNQTLVPANCPLVRVLRPPRGRVGPPEGGSNDA